jgi:hypothetical protein
MRTALLWAINYHCSPDNDPEQRSSLGNRGIYGRFEELHVELSVCRIGTYAVIKN